MGQMGFTQHVSRLGWPGQEGFGMPTVASRSSPCFSLQVSSSATLAEFMQLGSVDATRKIGTSRTNRRTNRTVKLYQRSSDLWPCRPSPLADRDWRSFVWELSPIGPSLLDPVRCLHDGSQHEDTAFSTWLAIDFGLVFD